MDKYCLICMKKIKIQGFNQLLFNHPICHNCFLKMNRDVKIVKINGIKVLSLFKYKDMMVNLIYQYKACNDIVLSSVFLSYDLLYLRLVFKGFYIVPVPSYIDHDIKRGFNHVKEIFKHLNLPIIDFLKKEKDFKQSSLSYKERKKSVSNINKNANISLKDKKILLVDDILTTGFTLKRCIELILKENPETLKVVVICCSSSKRVEY